jgi:hypothetical protein
LKVFLSNSAGKFAAKIRNQDKFGQPVALNFEGNDTFQTVPGGIMSLFFSLMLFGYSFMRWQAMTGKHDWQITQQTVVASLENLQAERRFDQMTNISMGL